MRRQNEALEVGMGRELVEAELATIHGGIGSGTSQGSGMNGTSLGTLSAQRSGQLAGALGLLGASLGASLGQLGADLGMGEANTFAGNPLNINGLSNLLGGSSSTGSGQ